MALRHTYATADALQEQQLKRRVLHRWVQRVSQIKVRILSWWPKSVLRFATDSGETRRQTFGEVRYDVALRGHENMEGSPKWTFAGTGEVAAAQSTRSSPMEANNRIASCGRG